MTFPHIGGITRKMAMRINKARVNKFTFYIDNGIGTVFFKNFGILI